MRRFAGRTFAAASIAGLLGACPAIATVGSHAAAPTPTWIFFRDRGALGSDGAAREAALAKVAERVTPRAVDRRARAARERGSPAQAPLLDDRDLGPDPVYVAAVAAAGAAVRTRSSWLNAVSVDATPEVLGRIEALPFVREARPVAVRSLDREGDDDADFNAGPSHLQLDMHHIPEVHAMGLHGEGVLICVLDSGFQLDHEAFRGLEVRAQRDFIFNDDDPSHDPRTDLPDQAGHGTLVLSTIGGYAPGKLVGAAYRAEFLLGKTERLGREERVEEDYWCAGVEWAEAMGADVISSSVTYHNWYDWRQMDGRTAVTTRAANLAFERGVVLVNSAGNTGWVEGRVGAPADALGAISVGAVDGLGNLAAFSTVGPTWDRRVKPDVCALGVGVHTATARTWDRYARINGTSLSTPLVAGVAALILEAHPDWGPEMVREALTMSADRAERPDNRYGWGIVNARDAVLYPLIEGMVTDSQTREPIEGAVVRWARVAPKEDAGSIGGGSAAGSDSPPKGSVRSDSTGAYVVPNLPRGSYRLIISKDGYFDAELGPYDVPPNLGDANAALRYRGE